MATFRFQCFTNPDLVAPDPGRRDLWPGFGWIGVPAEVVGGNGEMSIAWGPACGCEAPGVVPDAAYVPGVLSGAGKGLGLARGATLPPAVTAGAAPESSGRAMGMVGASDWGGVGWPSSTQKGHPSGGAGQFGSGCQPTG